MLNALDSHNITLLTISHMKLSIIIPVYNEARTIMQLLDRVEHAQLPSGMEREVIIVDDGSIDGTREMVAKLNGKHVIILHDKNRGKGASVKDGLARAAGDIAVIQDADLEYDPNEYKELLAPILEGGADVVYGSRLVTGRPHRVLYFWHSAGNAILTLFSNICTDLNLTDMETCYKMFTKPVYKMLAEKLTSDRFGIEPEITALVKKLRLYEVGISYAGRTYGEGKKINWKDGVAAFWYIIKFNLFR
jgi:glycosyltransferase involved in cell wall biosynthesis